MKKILLGATVSLSLIASVSKAQNIKPCGTDEVRDYYVKTIPGYKQKLDSNMALLASEFQAYKQKMAAQKTSSLSPSYTFTIPVVFHILHTGQNERTSSFDANNPNLADIVCINALNQVNLDFARESSDTSSIDPLYKPLYVNSNLHFELAKKDPLGNCTNGIVHHYDVNTNWDQGNIYNYKYSTIGTNNWLPSKYLNIYIVKDIIPVGTVLNGGTIIGYTHLPGTAPNIGSDAIVYDADFLFGLDVRSLSHEIGHWLGLMHTFGGSNDAGVTCGNDDIDDTPATKGFYSTCPAYATLDDICDPGNRPNLHNIMDYSGCPKMFTQGQTTKMRMTCESSTANRDYLVDTTNLIFTGVFNNPSNACAPIADFAANKFRVCSGQAITFNSTSYNATPSSYSWVFEGGTPATSTSAVQTVTYTNPGTYSVSLTVSNPDGTSTKTVDNYIITNWNSDEPNVPYTANFEDGLIPSGWYVNNIDFTSSFWVIVDYGSQGSNKSIVLPNGIGSSYLNGIDAFESPQFNFSNTTNISFSFDYSYARQPTTTDDEFELQYSTDCSGTWSKVFSSPLASALASATGGTVTAPYIPWSPNKWANKTIPSSLLGALAGKRDVKFRFWFNNNYNGAGQNLYIDNINISGTVGLQELENEIGLSIYPNPTSSSSVIEFINPSDAKIEVLVNDVTGRLIEQATFNVNGGSVTKHTINKSNNFNAGVYFVTLVLNNQKVTKKLIIE